MTVLRLAMKDIRHDRAAFAGLCIALAAILAPLLLLAALKTGITGAMLDELRGDPRTLQLAFLNDKTITPQTYAEIADLPGVGFVAPLGRQIAETVEIGTADLRTELATLQSSGEGDPFLGLLSPPAQREIVLSNVVADGLRVSAGDGAIVTLSNRRNGDAFDIDVTVLGVSESLTGRFVLAHPDLVLAVQAVAAGTAVPEFDIAGTASDQEAPDVTRLRLFAKGLSDVAPLTAELQARGFIIGSESNRIEGILRLERNLTWILGMLVSLAGAGYAIALSVSLWVNVQRKRKSLAMLRLMGLKTQDMVLFLLFQAGAVALIGTCLALGVAVLAGAVLNSVFGDALPANAHIAHIGLAQAAAVLMVTLGASLLSGSLGGFAIANMQPKEALRDV